MLTRQSLGREIFPWLGDKRPGAETVDSPVKWKLSKMNFPVVVEGDIVNKCVLNHRTVLITNFNKLMASKVSHFQVTNSCLLGIENKRNKLLS